MARNKDRNWSTGPDDGVVDSIHHANLSVLMDIRDELKELNSKLCRGGINQVKNDLNRIDRRLQANGLLVTKPRKKA